MFRRKPARSTSAIPSRPTSKRESTRSKDSPSLFVSSGSESERNDRSGTRMIGYVIPKPLTRPRAAYRSYKETTLVRKVLDEKEEIDGMIYKVQFEDYHNETVAFDILLGLPNGQEALHSYEQNPDAQSSSESTSDMELRTSVKRANRKPDYVDITRISFGSSEEDEFSSDENPQQRRSGRTLLSSRSSRSAVNTRGRRGENQFESDDSEEERSSRSKRATRSRVTRATAEPSRRSARNSSARALDIFEDDDEESSSDDELELLQSDIAPRKRRKVGRHAARQEKIPRDGYRKSDRSTRATRNMEEAGIEDIYRSDSDPANAAPKIITSGVKEYFQELPRNDEFRQRHIHSCDTCGNGTSSGPLIFCQGCVLTYHKQCLGHRANREHLVTKIGNNNFVLQCRRCTNASRKREQTAPDLGKCQACNDVGASCIPFRERKTPLQEQKEREENSGADPIANVNPNLINNVNNVLFRCGKCSRGFHFHHLEARNNHHMDIELDDEEAASERYGEYCREWLCKDCVNSKKVATIIAWRPRDLDTYPAGQSCEDMDEDEIEYLLKWEKQSYFRAIWMPGPWVWGVTAPAMRKAFYKREDGPKMRTEDAIPEEFLRIDIVLDVKYTSIVDIRTEEIDKARVKEVDEALIKYKGLGYEDAVWEKVPEPEDGERWVDFVTAYNDWILGRYVHVPKKGPLTNRLEKVRAQAFTKLEKSKQPENVIGGELMKYQVEGLNWLYYQWYSLKNGILADEMGLGKTIQIISFLATLVQDHNCFPFLVVVPNSTCANWRREIKQWAPSLRVVTYFGSSAARNMAYQYEMFPEGSKDLRCHVVVTSYEAAIDDSCRKFYRSVNWAGLIVDEGQRLKNDKSQLFQSLNTIRSPFRVLLTGTPLQNNARELFNLLHFLDDSVNPAELEEKYAEMTRENIAELHDLIRPFILRRTKLQVLTFLPPMAQIIVPVTMSFLQKQLYKSILAKNPDLLKALFSTSNRALRQNERASLNNILMQLRKCLCHPFVYSREIEERTDIAAVSHRNLVEASAKLQLLELLLPKLRERGHRVLIFSQFLDMLDMIEDFLDGLQMRYQRLDGTIGSLEKQKRIDEFNAPESPLFAFLLSTRAGGVGINLATADTVIILDPDFNPHQDVQALSRAHRIGQKKKVLCFQLMTRSSAEEKIVQMGRKKMALDHVVVESLDTDDLEEKDVESILKFGAAELFSEETANDIKYDDQSVDKLLDRSQMEETKSGKEDSAESQFSFARVWANNEGALEENIGADDEVEQAPDPSLWENILKERDRVAAAEAAARQRDLGRGKRARQTVDYGLEKEAVAGELPSPAKPVQRKKKSSNDSDTDFQAGDSTDEEEEGMGSIVDGKELASTPKRKMDVNPFERVRVPAVPNPDGLLPYPPSSIACHACTKMHPQGACPLKVAGVEYCGLCGIAHFGTQRVCPHLNSETQVREMINAIKNSGEPPHVVEAASKYLRGLKGNLVQAKKKKKERALGIAHGSGGGIPVMAVNGPRAPPAVLSGQNGGSFGGEDGEVASALLGYLGR